MPPAEYADVAETNASIIWPAERTVFSPGSLAAWPIAANCAMNCLMWDVLKLIWWELMGLLRSRASLEAEIPYREWGRNARQVCSNWEAGHLRSTQ